MFRGIALALCAVAGFAAPAVAAGDVAAGKKVFNRCKACHEAEKDANKAGPSLHGVIGRHAGAVEGFKYSAAMAKAGEEGLIWTEEKFSEYMVKPKDMIPGNTMSFAGLRKPEDIANLLAYLESVAPEKAEGAAEEKEAAPAE
ncbi:cytochrome c family protein [Neomegalonema sp.]|uniref:c-type cytochrome n=1 Tax=Neomegalonema sp. TaxID=2039713 RepID=UPI00261929FF|nr:cytochrome c family protein [Neomegalonema sp.]MDD2867509.1 cytochrome c family protein [Neomegalonema sp.]